MEVVIDNIKISDGDSMEDIGRYIYLNINKNNKTDIPIIIVVDGSKIKLIKDVRTLPTNWEYETKRQYNDVIEYYIRDKMNDTLYCIYGITSVLEVFPGIINYCDIASKQYYNTKYEIQNSKTSDDHINITRKMPNKFSIEIIKYSTPIIELTKLCFI